MKLDLFWLHFIIVLGIVLVAYIMNVRTMRLRACYNMYRVRDAFVLLVAQDVIPESSEVFKHYYGNINRLLRDAPKVGLDDMLATIFQRVKGAEFDRALAVARDKAKRMASDPLMKNDQVRQVVADYYVALRGMMLSHSSLLKLAYIVSRHLLAPAVARRLGGFVPGRIERGLQAVDYAEVEAKEFRPA